MISNRLRFLPILVMLVSGCGVEPAGGTSAVPAGPGSVAASSVTTTARPVLPAVSGMELAKRVRANLDIPYEKIEYAMELVDSTGQVESRRAVFQMASGLAAKDCAYVHFSAPPEIFGFGLLTLRPAAGDPEQFLYVPAAKMVTRVLYFSTNRRSSFCGTQFTFEDLEPLRVADHDFKVTGTELCEGVPCYLLESKPKSRFSGYSAVRSWVGAETGLAMKAVYDDPKGQLLKTAVSSEPFLASPGHWRTKKTVVTDHQSSRATRMKLEKYYCQPGALSAPEKAAFTFKTLSLGREG